MSSIAALTPLGQSDTAAGVLELAEAIYHGRLRRVLETDENLGKMLLIEPTSGDYQLAESGQEYMNALLAMHERHGGLPLGILRIGFTTAYKRGASMQRVPPTTS